MEMCQDVLIFLIAIIAVTKRLFEEGRFFFYLRNSWFEMKTKGRGAN